jgi:hypothetical protein
MQKSTPCFFITKSVIGLLVIVFVLLSFAPLAVRADDGPHGFPELTLEETLADMQRRLKAIALELFRLSIGLPPNIQGGAYPGVEDVDKTLKDESDKKDKEDEKGGGSGGSGSSGGTSGVSANQPFGGKTTEVDQSTCNCVVFKTTKITMTPAKAGLPRTVLYSPVFSKLYAFENISQTNINLVGSYVSNALCMKQTGWYCTSQGSYPLISIVGTSGSGSGDSGDTPPPSDDDENEPKATSTPPLSQCSGNLAQDWNFSSGIVNQIGDVSASLSKLLTCMCGRLKDKGISKSLITSISDSNHIGDLGTCRNPSTYPGQCSVSGSKCCWHSQGSCHYGGTNTNNKSYAADLGMANASAEKQAALACGAGYVLDEGNHIHIQTSDCRSTD